MDFSELKGQVALITGVASGMGKACAIVSVLFATTSSCPRIFKSRFFGQLFAKVGCKLAIADRDAKGLQAIADQLNLPKESLLTCALDITDSKAVEEFVRSIPQKFGRLDIAL